jgi:hypothetical protein
MAPYLSSRRNILSQLGIPRDVIRLEAERYVVSRRSHDGLCISDDW